MFIIKRTLKQWAKKAYELGYTQGKIRKAVEERGFTLPAPTLSLWIKKEKWKPLPVEERTPHKAVFLEKQTFIVPDEEYFPLHQNNATLQLTHGATASKATKESLLQKHLQGGISGEKAFLCASATPDGDSPSKEQGHLEVSDDIAQLNEIIKGYMTDIAFYEWRIAEMVKKLKKKPSAKELTGIVSVSTASSGINAGKEVNLKEQKKERQSIQLVQAIDRARSELVKARRLHAQTVETRAKIADMEARRNEGIGDTEKVSGLVSAIDRIADRIGTDADFEE